jgi:hypothetical protein
MESSRNEDENAVNVSSVVNRRELVDEILARRRRLATLETGEARSFLSSLEGVA